MISTSFHTCRPLVSARGRFCAPTPVFDFLRKARDLPNEIHTALSAMIEGERFSHVGQLRLFQRDGSLGNDEQEWQNREVIYSGTFSDLLKNFPNLLRAQLDQMLSIAAARAANCFQ